MTRTPSRADGEPSSPPAESAAIRTPQAGDALDALPRALVESSLEKVLVSDVFRRSDRHRRFMRHIVHAALDGRRDRLKEVLLGIELFDRRIDRYDPRRDPIVRVEAGRVRDKLARYYARDGAADAYAFEIPVGSYVPQFRRRDTSAATERSVESFAVLPFSSSGGRDDDVAFTICLADQLINRLGRMRDVKVVARISAFKARERNLDVRDIGRLLRVTHVVDGSVQRQGRRMRCIAHVYRARDGIVLWSQAFDSDVVCAGVGQEVDLFAFQDHIVDVVLAAVSPSATEQRTAAPSGVLALDKRKARDLHERATYLARRYDATTTGKVIELFGQAVALDPENLQAHLALAKAYFDQVALLNAPSSAVLAKVEAAVARAIELDPTNADAISLQAAVVFRFDFDWPRAQRLFRQALGISPHAITVNYRYALGLLFTGAFADGFRHLDIAVELDPLNIALRATTVHPRAYARDHARAEADGMAILELEPSQLYVHLVLGLNRLYQGDTAAAMERFATVIAALPDHPAAHFARVCALGLDGDRARGESELAALLSRLRGRHCPPFPLATAHACLGDRDAALTALERAARERDVLFTSLPVDPLFARYHADPDFLALLARHGLRAPVA